MNRPGKPSCCLSNRFDRAFNSRDLFDWIKCFLAKLMEAPTSLNKTLCAGVVILVASPERGRRVSKTARHGAPGCGGAKGRGTRQRPKVVVPETWLAARSELLADLDGEGRYRFLFARTRNVVTDFAFGSATSPTHCHPFGMLRAGSERSKCFASRSTYRVEGPLHCSAGPASPRGIFSMRSALGEFPASRFLMQSTQQVLRLCWRPLRERQLRSG